VSTHVPKYSLCRHTQTSCMHLWRCGWRAFNARGQVPSKEVLKHHLLCDIARLQR
jgi:hypothetical protein